MSISRSLMVAVKPGIGAADRTTVIGVQKPLKPRTSTRRDHELWNEELRDIAARHGLESMYSRTLMPSLAVCALQYPELKADELEAKLHELTGQWQELNTEWYHIVRASVELVGPFELIDRRHINAQFVGQGVLRDGQGLHEWARAQLDDVKVQSDLRKKLQSFTIAKGTT